MRYFVLPFVLSVPLAVPLLWYHLDGLDPVDITLRNPSQEEIDFADTREEFDKRQTEIYGPADQRKPPEDASSGPDGFFRTVESTPPGF